MLLSRVRLLKTKKSRSSIGEIMRKLQRVNIMMSSIMLFHMTKLTRRSKSKSITIKAGPFLE